MIDMRCRSIWKRYVLTIPFAKVRSLIVKGLWLPSKPLKVEP
ncbi:hypothetical protein SS05631_c13710 [Sinorhizobium sp. CCBAU 05631]|nr:hypothetical protein SS05631_c13710 [Sinorhizobium sp. CCBAU 05631]